MTSATIRLRAEERWQAGLPVRRLSTTMMLIALASAIGHLAILVGAALDGRSPPPPPQEIAVEIVQEAPKPIAEKAPPQVQPAKVETAKLDAAKPEPAKSEPVKPETKPEPTKAVAATEPAKPQPAPPPQKDVAAEEQKLAALQQELTGLQAEQAQLKADRAADAAQPAPLRETGLGPLPDTFTAVALPTSADGRGEAVTYEETVFSALAKAKAIGGSWLLPGTASVHFNVDAAGHLVDVALVRRSGLAELDAEALDIVQRAAPFPAPPQGAQRSFDANFTFKTQAAR